MQKQEGEWKLFRNLLQSESGCISYPIVLVAIVIVLLEKLFRQKSVLEKKAGISFNLQDIDFYSQKVDERDVTSLQKNIDEYLDRKNSLGGLYSSLDIPDEVNDSFYRLEVKVDQLVKSGEFRQAINNAHSWLQTLGDSQIGNQRISKSIDEGGSCMVTIYFLIVSDVLRLISKTYESLVESNVWELNDLEYYYLQAAIFRIRASLSNAFESTDKIQDDKKIMSLLTKAGFPEEASQIKNIPHN